MSNVTYLTYYYGYGFTLCCGQMAGCFTRKCRGCGARIKRGEAPKDWKRPIHTSANPPLS